MLRVSAMHMPIYLQYLQTLNSMIGGFKY